MFDRHYPMIMTTNAGRSVVSKISTFGLKFVAASVPAGDGYKERPA
jgi:hypothetical protein